MFHRGISSAAGRNPRLSAPWSMVLAYSNTYTKLGLIVRFERVLELVGGTPDDVLCRAWGSSLAEVRAVKQDERPITLRESGALAELHGLLLEDVLSV